MVAEQPTADDSMSAMSSMYEGGEGEEGRKEGSPKEESVDDQNAGNPTALLPKTILGGKTFKVGDEVVLKITADHGDEVAVAYATEKPGMSEEKSGAEELDEMDKKGGY
jgi:hypothetical protein